MWVLNLIFIPFNILGMILCARHLPEGGAVFGMVINFIALLLNLFCVAAGIIRQ